MSQENKNQLFFTCDIYSSSNPICWVSLSIFVTLLSGKKKDLPLFYPIDNSKIDKKYNSDPPFSRFQPAVLPYFRPHFMQIDYLPNWPGTE